MAGETAGDAHRAQLIGRAPARSRFHGRGSYPRQRRTAAVLLSLNGADACTARRPNASSRSEEHTSELQSLMRISYAVFCLKKKNSQQAETTEQEQLTHA